MSKTEFMEGIHRLQEAYNTKFDTEKLKFWYENLQDMDKEEYLKNIDSQIKSNQFIPNIAQIRNKQSKKCAFADYDQRDYRDIDFDSLYAN